jgi:hypothetical protein
MSWTGTATSTVLQNGAAVYTIPYAPDVNATLMIHGSKDCLRRDEAEAIPKINVNVIRHVSPKCTIIVDQDQFEGWLTALEFIQNLEEQCSHPPGVRYCDALYCQTVECLRGRGAV